MVVVVRRRRGRVFSMRWRHMHSGIYKRGRGEIISMIGRQVEFLDTGEWEVEVFSSRDQPLVSGIGRKEEGDVLHAFCRCAILEFGKERRRCSLRVVLYFPFW